MNDNKKCQRCGRRERQIKENANAVKLDIDTTGNWILPICCPEEKLAEMGVKFLSRKDDLFLNVILPDKWKEIPAEGPMWSYLHNEKGEKIASIFYKPEFYDRCAFLELY